MRMNFVKTIPIGIPRTLLLPHPYATNILGPNRNNLLLRIELEDRTSENQETFSFGA
jgi:hypothetical protein